MASTIRRPDLDFHAITPRGSELLMSVVDGEVIIVPPASQPPGTAPSPPQQPHPGESAATSAPNAQP